MSESHDRRQFRIATVVAFLACASISMGCGGASGNPGSPTLPASPSPAAGSVTGTVAGNHPAPHRAVITAAQLQAGQTLTLSIQGEAFHGHTLTLTGTEVTQIAGGARVSVTSSRDTHSDGGGLHSHVVTFN